MDGFFTFCNQDGVGSAFILQKEDSVMQESILQKVTNEATPTALTTWQSVLYSDIMHFVCLSVIVRINRLMEWWMTLDLESMYYHGHHWMTVGTTRLVWYWYTHFMFDGGRGIWDGEKRQNLSPLTLRHI